MADRDSSTDTVGNNLGNNSGSRGMWTGRIGFILAASGSAIGLGNIWKFPYITGVYGGGAFVLIYVLSVLAVGLPLMLAELIVGRHGQCNPVGAFQRMHRPGSPWRFAGWLGVASGFVILSFYSVVGGWSLSYLLDAINGFSGSAEEIAAQFGNLIASAKMSILWHTVFMVITVAIVAGGIQRGIERWSKILMPSLMTLLIGLMIYGLFFTTGGPKAISFLFYPDFSQLSAEAVLSALGHAFFTLSLGMGAMITYGSYMKPGESLTRDAITISFLDTVIALMAGIAIFSLVFQYGLEPAAGPGLIFSTLPVLFAQTGQWVSVPFFLLLSFAAITSAISLLEVVVSYFCDQQKWKRMWATIVMGAVIYCLGLISAMASLTIPFRGRQQGFFDVFDYISTNYMLPVGGLLTCVYVAWVVSDKKRSEEFGSSGPLYRGLKFTLRYVSPVAVFIVLLHGLELLPFVDY